MDLLILVEEKNSRIEYVFNHIFNHILGLEITLTTDLNLFNNSVGLQIEYSRKQVSNALFFQAVDFLFETGCFS